MATLPTTAAFSSTRTLSPSHPPRSRRLFIAASFLPSAPPPAGARTLRTSAAAAAAAPVEVGGVKIAREGEFSYPTVLKAGSWGGLVGS
jgi:phenylalanyl-tRNA synthetase alpha chain